MAVVSTYATPASNHRAAVATNNAPHVTEGVVRMSSATVAVAASDDDGSKFFLLPVHSSWSIKSIRIFNDAITGGTSYDLGLYTNAATPAAGDVDVYGTAIDLSSARTTAPLEALFEALDIVNVNKKVWENLALTSDPGAWYLLALTANTVGTAAGDITVIMQYVD